MRIRPRQSVSGKSCCERKTKVVVRLTLIDRPASSRLFYAGSFLSVHGLGISKPVFFATVPELQFCRSRIAQIVVWLVVIPTVLPIACEAIRPFT
jgi:hypothetical protein